MASRRAPRCPTCGEAVSDPNNSWRPFCTERCKLVDLGKWLGEEYRVPAYEEPLPDDLPPELLGASGEGGEN